MQTLHFSLKWNFKQFRRQVSMRLCGKQHIIEAFKSVKDVIEANRDYLIELDSQIGDGDLGLTMVKGFNAAYEAAQSFDGNDLGDMVKKIGFAIAKAAPSTMGTLSATGFIGIGKFLDGETSLDAEKLSSCFRVMAESISVRGKAVEGDKTLLDVLFPVARAVEASDTEDICDRLEIAYHTAQESLEKTKQMINQHGKAAVFREKSIGHLDPGATAMTLVIEGFYLACKGSH